MHPGFANAHVGLALWVSEYAMWGWRGRSCCSWQAPFDLQWDATATLLASSLAALLA
jgi:hypothetical protein